MYHKFPKLALTGVFHLMWAGFMVYLLTHVQSFYDNKAEKISVGLHLVKQAEANSNNSIEENVTSQPGILSPLNIIIQANSDTLGGLITVVNSVITNTKHAPSVHFYFIIQHDAVSHLLEWMKVPELSEVQYSYKELPSNMEKYSNAGKFLFLDLFPSLHGSAIYLDSDVVVQGDVADLLETPIPTPYLGAFSDDCHVGSASKMVASRSETRYASHLNLKHPLVAKLKLSPLTCTFNTGVFVASEIDDWRKEQVTEKILELLLANEESSIMGLHGGSDVVEAAMLIVLYKRTTPLEPMWHIRNLGVSRGSKYSPFFITNAKLLHWNGHFKPWKSSRSHGSTFEQSIWDRYFIRDPLGLFIPIRKKGGL